MVKVAFITGAAGGIGAAVAENFVKKGYQVVLVDLAEKKLQDLNRQLINKYKDTYLINTKKNHIDEIHPPIIFNIDVTDSNQIKSAVNQVIKQCQRIDVLFNGAGIARIGGSDMNPKEFEEIVKVNLFGTFNCIHEIAPYMKKQGSGYIFNVASRQGKMGSPNLAGYASSKFGVVGLSESILKELINTGVKVTALCPSYTNTPMMDLLDFPREEMLSPEDIVTTVNYLLSLSDPACVREVLLEIRKLVS